LKTAEPWLKETPQDWRRFRIKDIAPLSPGFSESAPAPTDQCVVIPMEAISEKGDIDTTLVQEFQDIQQGLTNFEKGDVLFAKITPCMENGKGAFVRELPTRYGLGSTEFHVLRPGRRVDGEFLYYFTFNAVYRAYAADNMTGAAGQKRVATRFLAYTPIFLPTFTEQRRIAVYLDKACTAIDGAIRAKRQQLEVLDVLRKSIIHRAVTRGLNEDVELKISGLEWIGNLLKHWKTEKLKRLLAEPLMYGTNEAAELDDPDLPRYIRITDFDDIGRLRADTFRSLPLEKAKGYDLSEGDLLFARSGATVGKAFLFTKYAGVACFAGYLIRARTDHRRLLPKYLYYYTKSPVYEGWKDQIFTQATIQNISATKYAYLPVVLPPLLEQEQIVEFLDVMHVDLSKLAGNLNAQVASLEQYRKSLIHECVTGKRQITEADLVAG
jgi:restriction endonuclease S subunit